VGGGGGGGGGGPTPPPPRPNQPPIADFNFQPSTGFAPLEVEFDGTASRDPDGRVVQWNWQFGDGGQGSGGHVFHTFQTQGVFQVKLTVVDDRGLTASAVKEIEVLGIHPPQNIRWQTFVDESVFMSRYVTEIAWDRNPANDRYNIVQYRIFRRNEGESGSWTFVAQTTGDVFSYRDTDVRQRDMYAYGITAVDSAGHESRLGTAGGSSSAEPAPSSTPGGRTRRETKPVRRN
jgi:PKD repeat protein